jgi:mono/diheme cytochrome c family protein
MRLATGIVRCAFVLLAASTLALARGESMAPAAVPATEARPSPPTPVSWARPVDPTPLERTPARIARGKYLAEGVTQCFICHSERDASLPGAPPKAGMKAAGQVMIDKDDLRVVAPNLTPDLETGAGSWPDDALVRAIREGVGHDGRPLHSPMWWWAFRRLSDEDVRSIVVYLRTLPPVRHPLPATRMPDAERAKLIRKLRPLTEAVPQPDQSTPLARGRYLIGIADCGGCHTAWEAPRNAGLYAGGNQVGRGGFGAVYSANLTPDPTGMAYDEKTFVTFMRNGKFNTLSPIMPWVVFRNMSDSDLSDIRTALRRLWPFMHRVNNSEPPTKCPVCLQEHGGGASNVVVVPKAVPVSRVELATYVGTYRAREDGEKVQVKFAGDHLVVDAGPDSDVLVPQGKGRFFEIGGLAPLQFELDGQGKVVRMVQVEVDDYVFDRVPDAAPPASE